jgi:hypothetical protein
MFFTKKADTATPVTIETPVSDTQIAFTDIRPQWKALAADRKITKEDIAALCFYRSLIKGAITEDALARLRRSFKPITNLTKIENGADPIGARKDASRMVKYSTVFTWLSESEQKLLLAFSIDVLKGGVK